MKKLTSQKNLANINHDKEDFNIDCEWNFFVTSHDKERSDSIGGTLKRAELKQHWCLDKSNMYSFRLIKQSCGPDVIIRCIPDGHFNTHTNVEISGSSNQIIKAAEFINNIHEEHSYKIPWLKGNTYFVRNYDGILKRIREHLKQIIRTDYNSHPIYTTYFMFGFLFHLVNFRPNLHHSKMLEIDFFFKSISNIYTPMFISLPNVSVTQNHSSEVSTTVLAAFNGTFLSYMPLEDIMSLEIANGGPDPSLCYDRNLNHDIQKYLQEKYSYLYDGKGRNHNYSYKSFRQSEVLRHFIRKYHNQLKHIDIPNILSVGEFQSLSRSYNTKLELNKINHIDFKTRGNLDSDNFCVIFHFDSNNSELLNYNSKHASNHLTIHFNADDSLDVLNCSRKFSFLAIKCQNSCTFQKTNSILKWVVGHFKVIRKAQDSLLLYEFDLNQVPIDILRPLLYMMREGTIEFQNMSFDLKTFLTILKHCNGNHLCFRKCNLASDRVDKILDNSKLSALHLYDMDVELNLICMLQNVDWVEIMNCHILSTSFNKFPINLKIIRFSHTSFDLITLIRIMYCLQVVGNIELISCSLTPSVFVDAGVNHFPCRNEVVFINIDFKIQEIFQIFQHCQFEEFIFFENCHFRFDDVAASKKFSIAKVLVEFRIIKLDYLVLLTILATLNHQSRIRIVDSCILHTAVVANISTKLIEMAFIEICNCRLGLQTLLNILSKTSENTEVLICNCALLNSSVVLPHPIKLRNLNFCEMKLSLNDLFTILLILKKNSSLTFSKCEINSSLTFSKCEIGIRQTLLPNKMLRSNISIEFHNMTIEEEVRLILIQTDLVIDFIDCDFKEGIGIEMPPNSVVALTNRKLDLSTQFGILTNATPTSTIKFYDCDLFMSTNAIPNIVLKWRQIRFKSTKFHLDVLVAIMERMSDQSKIVIDECVIKPRKEFPKLPIKTKKILLKNMTVEIRALLDILTNCTNLSQLVFDECEIVSSNPKGKTSMNNVLVVFLNVSYSSGFLQLCQHLTGNFSVVYYGQLSPYAIVELYFKTLVYGSRLKLLEQSCTKLLCFELFAEYFHYLARLKFKPKTDMEYDAPTFIIPMIPSLSLASLNDLKELKIKFIAINDGTTKAEFLRVGKPIDLFYELNDLPDDSEECSVDYY